MKDEIIFSYFEGDLLHSLVMTSTKAGMTSLLSKQVVIGRDKRLNKKVIFMSDKTGTRKPVLCDSRGSDVAHITKHLPAHHNGSAGCQSLPLMNMSNVSAQ